MVFRKPNPHNPDAHTSLSQETTTDDSGAYDFSDLAAGEYFLAVKADPWYSLHRNRHQFRPNANNASEANAALDVAYPVTYFDGTTDEGSAASILLAAGDREEASINLHAVPALRLAVATPLKPEGSIARAELRQSIFGTQVGAVSAGFFDAMEMGYTEFNGVAPGHYELVQGDPPRIADLDATSSQQVDPLLGKPMVTVSGTVNAASGPLQSAGGGEVTLTLVSIDAEDRQNQLQTACLHGAFNFHSVPQGAWELWAQNSGRRLPIASIAIGKVAQAGNRLTVRDRPLTLAVTISENATRIDGFARRNVSFGSGSSTPQGKNGKGVAGAMVLLVPSDLTAIQALARRDQSDSDGSFSLRDVVPGQYTIVAIEDGWNLDWVRTGVIGRYLSYGIPVTVTGTSGKTLNLSAPVPVQSRLP
jgi:hypothetical protein